MLHRMISSVANSGTSTNPTPSIVMLRHGRPRWATAGRGTRRRTALPPVAASSRRLITLHMTSKRLPKHGAGEAEVDAPPHRLIDEHAHARAHLAALGQLLQPPPIACSSIGRNDEGRSQHDRGLL